MPLLSRLAVQAARAYGMLVGGSPNNVPVTYLVVAGGGGGAGAYTGGGGGAGGYQTSTATLSILNTYSITVGAGGAGTNASGGTGTSGSNSILSGTGLSTITSTGGGGGGGSIPGTSGTNGASGGSGGGGGSVGSLNGAGGTGTSGQGNNGGAGNGINGVRSVGGGGGGAGAVGGTSSSTTGGVGGAGSASSISGSSVTYAGGGGGGSDAGAGGAGGAGGGGAGGGSAAGTAATTNTGGGGGGGGLNNTGAAGGSGIVIISYASATPRFVGGTITTSGGNQIHTFTSSGTLSPITPITASYLVVAGGGGGGNGNGGGGGGAGGYQASTTTLYYPATYIVTVGAGGTGQVFGGATSTNGSNSILSGTGLTTVTSTGGGAGRYIANGVAGGSGGGGSGSSGTGGTGTSGQGNNGGNGSIGSVANTGGGGGGAGAVGSNASGGAGGAGGAGSASSITGTSITYAGGGGGGSDTRNTGASGGAGGSGGGGAGSVTTVGGSGTANTGGGGGGAGYDNVTQAAGGAGGSGIVIISYAGSQVFNGGLVTTSGGNTIHTFTSTGALTPLTNNLTNSLRFRRSVTASLTRTPTVAGNRRTFTWSAWVKRGVLDSHQFLLSAATSTAFCAVDLLSNNMRVNFGNGTYLLVTTQVFRDPSAWYHIVLAVDTTQATDANRVRLFVNGNQVTAFSTAVYPIQNYDTAYNNTVAQRIGVNDVSDSFDGYMDDIYFIDGQALEPYFFGNNDANGVWKPIQYRGTYGTNGFYLNFSNTTSTTTLGFDSSPNGNNWTTNNISLTAGVTYDAMTDVPTNTSATQGNYCTLNPTIRILSGSITEGNLRGAGSDFECWGTMAFPSTGKFYFEYTQNGSTGAGAGPGTGIQGINPPDVDFGVHYHRDGRKWVNGTYSSYGATFTTNDIIGVAYDADSNSITFYKNNVSQGAISTTSGYTYLPYQFDNSGNGGFLNFGQRPFAYTPPTGFVALNTFNLPTPTILQGNRFMDATLYTQNGAASNVIVNQGQFRPDLVWIKCRSNAGTWNVLVDSVRGVSSTLATNSTAAQDTFPVFSSFNSNGFTLPLGDSGTNNTAGRTQVAWQWQAGQGNNTTNTAGSITSTVSVNTTAGFSVVTYTGSGAAGTVGHGLGVAPAMIITKNRTTAGNSWVTWHKALTNAYSSTTGFVYIDQTAASGTTTNFYDGTAMTSSTFRWQTGNININSTSNNYVSYVWAEIAGFSAFGRYTGNGNANGPFIYTGFRPEYILIKRVSDVSNWLISDTSRSPYNNFSADLYANISDAEYSSGITPDFLSNGFKIRTADTTWNTNGGTFIYAAFAENPFKNANAR